jgi:RsiW-degrading membrane proteinase PrsW (M82 family)
VAIPSTMITVTVVFAAAFAPSLIYLTWIRNREKFAHEPMAILLRTFIYGAVVGIIVSYVFESLIAQVYMQFVAPPLLEAIVPTLVIAPIVEEGVKPIGVYILRNMKSFVHPIDGAIYGVASGLGFAATENLIYESQALLKYGFAAGLLTVAFRAVTSTFIHASATGLTGYGIGEWKFGASAMHVAFFFIIAVLLHSIFNYVSIEGEFLTSLILAIASIAVVVVIIRE